jgi:hypothetical protein
LHYYNLPAGGCRAAESRIEGNASIWGKTANEGPVTGLCVDIPRRRGVIARLELTIFDQLGPGAIKSLRASSEATAG